MSKPNSQAQMDAIDDENQIKDMEPPTKRRKVIEDQSSEGSQSGSEDNENGGAKDGKKWSNLEHNGMNFCPAYKPHGVKVKFKGEPLELSPELEEICSWWASVEGTDFGDKPLVKRNFSEAFLARMPQSLIEKDAKLEDFDFQNIKEHLAQQKEIRNARPTEEKKKETKENQEMAAKFKQCLWDSHLQPVAQFMTEPPGIFRGRGEHPHAGKLKERIMPEFVSLNCGLNAPIPICPVPGHSWKSVIENQDATWLCQFKDERCTFATNQKYVMLSADSTVKGLSDCKKYERASRLKDNIVKVRSRYQELMSSPDQINNMLGVCTYLIDRLALRVGNEKGEDEADTVGCCSLRVEHIHFEDGQQITLDFLGKDSMRYLNTIKVEEMVHKRLKQFCENKQPTDEIFDKVSPARLNEFLKEFQSDLSAKVFRTYNASITLQQELCKPMEGKTLEESDTVETKFKFYNDCNRKVALLCNHQKAVSKNHDDQMQKINELIDSKRQKLKMLQELRKCLKDKKDPKGELLKFSKEADAPKTLDKCQAKIAKLKEQLEKDEIKAKDKDDNKSVALGTSKINYMDPRITISWCKRMEMPIEKIFAATLRKKFTWAMSCPVDYKF